MDGSGGFGGTMGGFDEQKDATEEIQKICDQVKVQVEKRTGKNYLMFKAVQYTSQVVAGFNYIIKVHVGEQDYIHLSLLQELMCNGGKVVVRGVQQHKTKEESLEPKPFGVEQQQVKCTPFPMK